MSMKDIYLAELDRASGESFDQLFDDLYLQVDFKWIERALIQGIPANVSL
ncbi:hypothetical protein [Paenibacillus sp. PCH8]|nr:hypothetical protein [Paenibacillus sp. PCH8]